MLILTGYQGFLAWLSKCVNSVQILYYLQ